MIIEVDEEIVQQGVKYYGKEKQSIVCMDECAELMQAILKELRGKSNKNHLAEEMADVIICIETLKHIYGISSENISSWIVKKQERTRKGIVDETSHRCCAYCKYFEFLEADGKTYQRGRCTATRKTDSASAKYASSVCAKFKPDDMD